MFTVKVTDGTEFGPADLDTIVQWAREGRIPRDALLYPSDGGDPKSVFAEARLAAILGAPPTVPSMQRAAAKPTSRLFPTGNQPALWGYYISVVSFLIPLLCPISFTLGVIGVIRALTNSEAKGLFHAITAIVLSIGAPLFWYAVWQWIENM